MSNPANPTNRRAAGARIMADSKYDQRASNHDKNRRRALLAALAGAGGASR